MKLIVYSCSLLLLAVILLSGCTPDQSSQQADSTQLELPTRFIQRFKGTIDKYPITVSLLKNDTTIEGQYYYDRVQAPILLTGSIKQKTFLIQERNEQFETTAEFSGSFITPNRMEGTWTNLKSKQQFLFTLDENHDGIAQLSVKDYHQENCEATDDDLRAIYNTDSICGRIDLSVISVTAKSQQASDLINQIILREVCNITLAPDTTFQSIDQLIEYGKTRDALGMSTDVACELVTNDMNILCLRVTEISYSVGANHPNAYSKFYNFDISTGKLLELKDILLPGFEKNLNTLGEKYFVKENGSDGWYFEPGTFELNKNFAIGLTGLEFSFDAYEIGAYVMGAPSVSIPYKDLQELINPASVIGSRKTK